MLRLTRIGLGGFMSIKDLQPFPVRPVNVLVGANGSGKSNLISFFRLLASIPAGRLQLHVGRAGGANSLLYYGVKQTPALWAVLEFEGKAGKGQYLIWLASTATGELIFADEQVEIRVATGSAPKRFPLGSGHRESRLLESGNDFPEVADLLSGIRVFHFEDTSEGAAIRSPGYVDDNRQIHPDGGNLAAFLFGLRQRKPQYYDRIVSSIRLVAPFFDNFDLAPMQADAKSIRLNWTDRNSNYVFGPHQLSGGTLRAMALITLLAQPEDELPGLIVIDEPETGLHPYAIEIVAALVKSASVHRPVIVATQSVAMVNQFSPEDIIAVTRDGPESKFERQNSETLAVWLEEYSIGEIWEKNLIGGTPYR